MPSPTISPTPASTPGFEFLFAVVGILAAIYLSGRKRYDSVFGIYDVATEGGNIPEGTGVSPQRICCVI